MYIFAHSLDSLTPWQKVSGDILLLFGTTMLLQQMYIHLYSLAAVLATNEMHDIGRFQVKAAYQGPVTPILSIHGCKQHIRSSFR